MLRSSVDRSSGKKNKRKGECFPDSHFRGKNREEKGGGVFLIYQGGGGVGGKNRRKTLGGSLFFFCRWCRKKSFLFGNQKKKKKKKEVPCLLVRCERGRSRCETSMQKKKRRASVTFFCGGGKKRGMGAVFLHGRGKGTARCRLYPLWEKEKDTGHGPYFPKSQEKKGGPPPAFAGRGGGRGKRRVKGCSDWTAFIYEGKQKLTKGANPHPRKKGRGGKKGPSTCR